MKYIETDAEGKIIARYDTAVNADSIPPGAVEVSDDDFFRTIREKDGEWRAKDGSIEKRPLPAADRGEMIAAQWRAIKARRDGRKDGGFRVVVGGVDKWFHSDAASRIQHLGLKAKARDLLDAGAKPDEPLTTSLGPVRWKTMDASFVTMTVQLAGDILDAAFEFDSALFTAAEIHRVAMEGSPDPTRYDFSGGWPRVFGE